MLLKHDTILIKSHKICDEEESKRELGVSSKFLYTYLANFQPLMQRYFTKAAILDGNLVNRMKAKHVLTETKPQVSAPACCILWRLVTSNGGSLRKTKTFSSLLCVILVRKHYKAKEKPPLAEEMLEVS